MQKIISTTYTATKEDGSEPCYDPIVTVTEQNEVSITVSTAEELNAIDTTNLMEGSTAIVTETGTSYVLDDEGNWVELSLGGQ